MKRFALTLVSLAILAVAPDPTLAGDNARILLLGDSHSVESFGRRMDRLLRRIPGAEVSVHAAWGSSPSWWTDGASTPRYFRHDESVKHDLNHLRRGEPIQMPTLTALLATVRPTLTIVALGSNLYGTPADYSENSTVEMARAIVQAGSQCLWVGFPVMRARRDAAADELHALLQRVIAPYCHYFDSRAVTYYPAIGGDGIHFDGLGPFGRWITRRWSNAVLAAIEPEWLNP